MRSQVYEQALQKQGVEFSYMEKLDVNAIDDSAGLRNQARLENPHDEELIAQYTVLSKGGSEPPAIVVYKRRNKNIWVPIDGNQRIAVAKRMGNKTVDAYVVQSNDQMVLDRLTWSFNNLVNGKRLTREESLEHAVTMVQKYGWDVKAAAQEWGIHPRTVNKRITSEKLRGVLRGHDFSNVCNLSDDRLDELSPIVNLGEDVFCEAASTTYNCGLTDDDIMELKGNINKAKTNEAKIQAVKDFRQSETARRRRAETKGGTFKPRSFGMTPSEQLHRGLKTIEKLLNEFSKEALRRKGVGYKETHELAHSVTDGLIQVFGLGARLNGKVKEMEGPSV